MSRLACACLFALAMTAFPEEATPRFDPFTVATSTGVIKDIVRTERGATAGVHLKVDTELEVIDVHLGPATFVDAQPVKLAVGQRVTVTGSWVSIGSASYLLATTVKHGTETLRLRDHEGRPLWRRSAPPTT